MHFKIVILTRVRLVEAEVDSLLAVLDLPDQIRTHDGSVASAKEAFLMLLRRLSEPARLCDIEMMFGWERSRVSRMATTTARLIYERWHHLLEGDTRRLTPTKLLHFSHVLRIKGCPLAGCWSFGDGRRKKHLRPVRNQRLVYNGWVRGHCLAWLALITPDGIIVFLFGPVEGRRHDQTVLNESGLLAWLDQHSHGPNGEHLVIYCDAGYAMTNRLIVPYTGAQLTADQRRFNYEMSRVREAVEWGFAGVTRSWAFLQQHRQRLLLEPLGLWYIVATLLTNAVNILRPNQISQYFSCPPPSLEEYFSGYPDDYHRE
ncbi:hypothetical protein AURDEDRAFT_73974 [Auricularia subglabra TFB-10046 SS5]|uniref:DDE Tnp4 domain-containing protein n=1 Tax=Auricularia subglabra (strain TFB-10046 / SS5) TaxID=717982 RepID=J0WTF5_AURST|nr:hypothetical protein AURDEDRAFT_73974 [Auricularia subglabra TFB-10046 SS5]